MNTVRRWNIYVNYFNGKQELLTETPFIGDTIDVTEEASNLIADLEGVESVEYKSLGIVYGNAMTLPAGAGGMEGVSCHKD
jgi:hypothetical protein